MDPIVRAVQARVSDPKRATDCVDAVPSGISACVTSAQLAQAEAALGFTLPPLLKELYGFVGNGGFGPAYGLLGIPGGATNEDGYDCVRLYLGLRTPTEGDPHWSWPEKLLPVGHLGCGMYACVDCSSPDGVVVWFEPNPHVDGEPWDDAFVPLAPSLCAWLEAWLDGRELHENAWNAKFPPE